MPVQYCYALAGKPKCVVGNNDDLELMFVLLPTSLDRVDLTASEQSSSACSDVDSDDESFCDNSSSNRGKSIGSGTEMNTVPKFVSH